MPTSLTIDLPVLAGVIAFDGLRVSRDEGGARSLESCAARYRDDAGPGASPGSIPGVQVARELFRTLGLDPTKRRPSSEALLNRALKGKPMPAVSTLVDVGNWCSLDFLLPLGLYDVDRIRGGIVLRRGGDDDGYEAISGRSLSLAGRYLLADDDGAFGSPITDSLRTAVSEATIRALVLLWAPPGYDSTRLAQQASLLADRVVDVCGGSTVEDRIVAGPTV